MESNTILAKKKRPSVTIGGHFYLVHLPRLPRIYTNHLLNSFSAFVIFLSHCPNKKDPTFSLLLACQNPDLVPPPPL